MSAVDAYRTWLAERFDELVTFPIDALDRVGVSVWSASAWGPEGDGHGVGYGATPLEAERGGWGEVAESYGALHWAATVEPERGPLRDGAVHPTALSLPLGTELDPERELLWVPAERWPDGGTVLVPLEAVATTAAEYERAAREHPDVAPLFPPITNGLGAGTEGDLERAVSHGLNELLQRHLNWSQFKALDTGRAVDPGTIDAELAARCARAGVGLVLKYAGHAYGVHGFHAAAVDEDPRSPVVRTATGEGADADPVRAARKALLECCSSRSRKAFFFGGAEALSVAPEPYARRYAGATRTAHVEHGVDLTDVFETVMTDPRAVDTVAGRITQVRETVPLPPAFAPGDRERLLAAAGLDVLVVRMTAPDDEVQVAKVIVPGLEAEVLSHHRLGPLGVAQLHARCPEAVHHGDAAPGEHWRRAGDGTWVDAGRLRDLARTFLPLYREPDRHECTA